MEATVIGILIALGGGIIGYFVHTTWTGTDARRTRRLLRRTKVTRIADLDDGKLACIVGRIEADGPLVEALMSRMACVAYETVVQVLGTHGINVGVEVTRRHAACFIVDDSGRARIDAGEVALANRPFMKSERYEERVIENGARVRIVGSVVLDPTMQQHADHAYREGALTATITGTSKWPLLIDLED